MPQSVVPAISGPVLFSASSETVWGSAAGGLFSWEPFDFGLRGATVHEAEAGVVRARAEEGLTRLAVQNAVGVAFLGVISAQQAVVAAEADVESREILSRAAQTLADNQLRPGAEASRAGAERAAAQTRAIQARQFLVMAQTTLSQVLGIVNGPVTANATGLLDDVPATAPQTISPPEHPLVQSSQAAVALAHAREEVLAETNRPRIYLQSSVFARGSGANPDGSFDGGADGLGLERANWAAGVQVVVPNLFDFASLRSQRAAAGAMTRAESARSEEAILNVTSQQRMAAAALAAARAIAQNTPIQLGAAQQSEAQARARYAAGLASIVEVAEAQSLLATAEYQNAVARVDVWRATAGAGRGAGKRRLVHRTAPHFGSAVIMWLIRAALRRPITVLVAVIAVALTAGFAINRMRADIFPDLDLPVIYVAQPYGGMSPAQMEGYITYYYEYHFLYINGIESVESKSIQNTSLLKLTFHPGTDMSEALAQTIGYVNRARAFMPPGTVGPFIMRFDAGTVPVGYLVFRSDSRSLGEIQDLALNRVQAAVRDPPGPDVAAAVWWQPTYHRHPRRSGSPAVLRYGPGRGHPCRDDRQRHRAVWQREHRRRNTHLTNELGRRHDQRPPRAADPHRGGPPRVDPRCRLGQRQRGYPDCVCIGQRPSCRLHPGHETARRVHLDGGQRGQGEPGTFSGARTR